MVIKSEYNERFLVVILRIQVLDAAVNNFYQQKRFSKKLTLHASEIMFCLSKSLFSVTLAFFSFDVPFCTPTCFIPDCTGLTASLCCQFHLRFFETASSSYIPNYKLCLFILSVYFEDDFRTHLKKFLVFSQILQPEHFFHILKQTSLKRSQNFKRTTVCFKKMLCGKM